jgi:hypothetical protein
LLCELVAGTIQADTGVQQECAKKKKLSPLSAGVGSIEGRKRDSMAYKFHIYHPHLTFSDSLNTTHFVKPNGKQGEELSASKEALFRIGKEAYEQLFKDVSKDEVKYGEYFAVKSKEDFDHVVLSHYFKFIDDLRPVFQKMVSDGKLKLKDSKGKELNIEWSDTQNNQIVDLAWQIFSKLQSTADAGSKRCYVHLFLLHALIAIDDALICLDLHSTDAVSAAIEAANALANAMAIESGSAKLQKARQEMSYRGAMEKLARDPKQKEKAFIFACWQKWQESPTTYASKAAFARDMLTKCEHLTSQKKIEDWCREWGKANPAG